MPIAHPATRSTAPRLPLAQRTVLLHLLTDHDAGGLPCGPAHLAHEIGDIPMRELLAALDELERHCLIDRTGERFHASPAARHIDSLQLIAI